MARRPRKKASDDPIRNITVKWLTNPDSSPQVPNFANRKIIESGLQGKWLGGGVLTIGYENVRYYVALWLAFDSITFRFKSKAAMT
jgi:hypothetical protein